MSDLEVIVRFKVRPGQLEALKGQAGEILRLTRQTDTNTLRCDWFINQDGTEGEVHELFPSEQALIEHKMNTMAATADLFRDYAFDHQATIYGEVSQGFIDLATQRMGAPRVFSFVQGMQAPAGLQAEARGVLEVIARLSVRPGQLEGFKSQAVKVFRAAQDQDTQTLRYDWFINQDGSECEVHEAYQSEDGLLAHSAHVMEARELLFRDYAFDHRMSVYSEITPHMHDLFRKHADGVGEFILIEGLAA